MGLSDCQTNGIGDTLAERASGDLNTGSVMSFRVARGYAVDVLSRGKVFSLGGKDMSDGFEYNLPGRP